MNANPQSDHPPHTCSSAPNYTLKTKPKKQADHPLRHVLQAPKNKFPGPNGTPFSEKNEDRKSGSKTVPPLYFFNKNGPKNDYFCSLSGHIRTEIQSGKERNHRGHKNGPRASKTNAFYIQDTISTSTGRLRPATPKMPIQGSAIRGSAIQSSATQSSAMT